MKKPKGNPEFRFRADQEFHTMSEKLMIEMGTSDKSAAAKLLMTLGNDKIKEAVNYLDGITHPLNDRQFEDLFLSLKIRIKLNREQRKKIKKHME